MLPASVFLFFAFLHNLHLSMKVKPGGLYQAPATTITSPSYLPEEKFFFLFYSPLEKPLLLFFLHFQNRQGSAAHSKYGRSRRSTFPQDRLSLAGFLRITKPPSPSFLRTDGVGA